MSKRSEFLKKLVGKKNDNCDFSPLDPGTEEVPILSKESVLLTIYFENGTHQTFWTKKKRALEINQQVERYFSEENSVNEDFISYCWVSIEESENNSQGGFLLDPRVQSIKIINVADLISGFSEEP